jgi:hypothetical protein
MAYPAMLKAIDAAAASVEFETYTLRADAATPVVYSLDVSNPEVKSGMLHVTAQVGSQLFRLPRHPHPLCAVRARTIRKDTSDFCQTWHQFPRGFFADSAQIAPVAPAGKLPLLSPRCSILRSPEYCCKYVA